MVGAFGDLHLRRRQAVLASIPKLRLPTGESNRSDSRRPLREPKMWQPASTAPVDRNLKLAAHVITSFEGKIAIYIGVDSGGLRYFWDPAAKKLSQDKSW